MRGPAWKRTTSPYSRRMVRRNWRGSALKSFRLPVIGCPAGPGAIFGCVVSVITRSGYAAIAAGSGRTIRCRLVAVKIGGAFGLQAFDRQSANEKLAHFGPSPWD